MRPAAVFLFAITLATALPVTAASLKVSLIASPGALVPPGPIMIRASLENIGKTPVDVCSRLATNSGPMSYFVVTPDKRKLRIRVDPFVSSKQPLATLQPGEAIHHDLVFLFVNDSPGNEIYPLLEGGEFLVQAEYDESCDGKGKLVATTSTLRSSKLVEADRAAVRFWKSAGELAGALGFQSAACKAPPATSEKATASPCSGQEFRAKRERFLRDFPDDPLAPYVALNLASEFWGDARSGPEIGPYPAALVSPARDWYRWVTDHTKDPYLLDDGLAGIATTSVDLGDTASALSALDRFEKQVGKDGESEHLRTVAALRWGLERKLKSVAEILQQFQRDPKNKVRVR